MPGSVARPSDLLATSTTGLPVRRSQLAKWRSARVTPSRASMRRSPTSASPSARAVCACIRPVNEAGAASSSPAVSTTRKPRSAIRPSPSRRSRVTPGVSSTRASRRPTSRLNNVDLPTFGRPRIATAKLIGARAAPVILLPIGRQIGVVGQHVKGIVGDHRRCIPAGRHLFAPERLAGVGRDGDRIAGGGEHDQPITPQHRTGPGHRILLFLFVLIARQLIRPADLAVIPSEADELVVIRQNIQVVAGDPGAMRAAEFLLPGAIAGSQIDRRDTPAMAGREDPATVEDRTPPDICEAGDGVDAAGIRKVIGP